MSVNKYHFTVVTNWKIKDGVPKEKVIAAAKFLVESGKKTASGINQVLFSNDDHTFYVVHDRYEHCGQFVSYITSPIMTESLASWFTGPDGIATGQVGEVLGEITEEAKKVALGFTPFFTSIVFYSAKPTVSPQ